MKPQPAAQPAAGCAACPLYDPLQAMGISMARFDRVVALAGNPNTGKSTVFNALTGLRQHTGNWPGKTVTRAEGGFRYRDLDYKLVDLPGTYSLLSASQDEEIARNFLLFGRPDCTVVVADATALERNLNLVLQVLEVTERAVICVNLMDEARRKGIHVDVGVLSDELGVPAVGTVARTGEGLPELAGAIWEVTEGQVRTCPRRPDPPRELRRALEELVPMIERLAPGLPNARWVAYRLLDGDHRVRQALLSGELAELVASAEARAAPRRSRKIALQGAQ
ncbi:MAG: 50S ribosome-binding GTPase [Gemmatimonadetes bacterium]|nr:50S ribosome-binding GTPase [Gemmatimonadota bacterium]